MAWRDAPGRDGAADEDTRPPAPSGSPPGQRPPAQPERSGRDWLLPIEVDHPRVSPYAELSRAAVRCASSPGTCHMPALSPGTRDLASALRLLERFGIDLVQFQRA
jgi:hypothetical protein